MDSAHKRRRRALKAYRRLLQHYLQLACIVQEPVGVSLAENVTHFSVYSNLVHVPLSMKMQVWLVISGGCGQEGHANDPSELG